LSGEYTRLKSRERLIYCRLEVGWLFVKDFMSEAKRLAWAENEQRMAGNLEGHILKSWQLEAVSMLTKSV
jgi:hypothetical protein